MPGTLLGDGNTICEKNRCIPYPHEADRLVEERDIKLMTMQIEMHLKIVKFSEGKQSFVSVTWEPN